MDNKLEQALERAAERVERQEWEFDKYFSQVDGVYRQEHIIYKRRPKGGVERTTITRHYFAGGDYQDSTETVIL